MARRKDRQRGKIKVPVGLEKVLFHAAQDEEFKNQLFDDRAKATVQDAGCDADDCVDTDPPGLMDAGGDRPDDDIDGG